MMVVGDLLFLLSDFCLCVWRVPFLSHDFFGGKLFNSSRVRFGEKGFRGKVDDATGKKSIHSAFRIDPARYLSSFNTLPTQANVIFRLFPFHAHSPHLYPNHSPSSITNHP